MILDHLSSHSQIFGYPTETRFLPSFIKNQSQFGDLSDEHNFLRLWQRVDRLLALGAQGHSLPSQWQSIERSVAGAFDAHMKQSAAAAGKSIWCEKTPMHVHHLHLLAAAFPRARFIHVIRDGRDCAASFHRRWRFNPVRTIYRWKHAVRSGRSQGVLLAPRYLEVRYEMITKTADAAFYEICDFLNVPFEPRILGTARSRTALDVNGSYTIVSSRNRASSYFNRTEVAKLEMVAGRYLTELGYLCNNATGDRDPPYWKLCGWQFTDDIRRLAGIVTSGGRLFKPRKWRYVIGRMRRRLKL